MRVLMSLFGVLAGIVLLVVSAAMNWRFGFSLGKTELDAQIYAAASAAADGLKALLPFFILWALRQKNLVQVTAGILLWCVCSAYSLTSSLGFAALNRADTVGAREAQAVQYSDLRAELKRAREKLSWVPQHRSMGEVDADLQSVLAQPIRKGRRTLGTVGEYTQNCSNVNFRSQRLCNQVLNLRKELAVSRQAYNLETQIKDLKNKLDVMSAETRAVATAGADPQAKMLSNLIGVDIQKVQIGLIILVALLVELGSGLGLFVAYAHMRPREADEAVKAADSDFKDPETITIVPPPAKRLMPPNNDLKRFHEQWVEPDEDSSVTATEIYEHYRVWCEVFGKDPMALPVFGRNYSEMGVQKAKIGGRIRYIGISLIRPEIELVSSDGEAVA